MSFKISKLPQILKLWIDNTGAITSHQSLAKMDQNINLSLTKVYVDNITGNFTDTSTDISKGLDVMMILRLILSSVGIIGNLNVLIVLLNHNKFRKRFQIYL